MSATNEWAFPCQFAVRGDRVMWCIGKPEQWLLTINGEERPWIICGAHRRKLSPEERQRVAEMLWFRARAELQHEQARRLERA